MSSSYSAAELEAMRKARIKAELALRIQQIKEQLQEEHENKVHVVEGLNIKYSVFIEDNAVSGYDHNVAITSEMFKNHKSSTQDVRDELDFSGLLKANHSKPTKLELELDSWLKRVDERPVVSEKDEKDRTRLIGELAKIINDSATDIEDKIKVVKMRVKAFLEGSVRLNEADKERIKAVFYEYCALCKMLEVEPTEYVPYRVEKEVARMNGILEKRKQDEYIMSVIEEIMEDLGCHVKDDAVLDHTMGQMYSVEGHPLCDVFVGKDDSGIMFEPVGKSKGDSLDKKRQIENSANSICSLYATIEERAAEKGVFLRRVFMEPAHLEQMYIDADVSERKARKKKGGEANTPKERTIKPEG